MKTVFVTGPDGLLGNHVLRGLIQRGCKVRAMVQKGRDINALNELPIEIVFGDITDCGDVESLSKGFDYFIHIAAITDMWPSKGAKYYKVNVDGTANAIQASLKNGIKRFVHIGSASSFGFGDANSPGNENSTYRSSIYDHDYLESKRIGQKMVLDAVKEKNLPAIVLCPTFMIGAYDAKPSSGAMLLAIAKKKLPFLSSGGKNWVSAKAVAEGICNALDMGRIGESYILGGQNVTYPEMVKTIANVIGQNSFPKTVIPDAFVVSAGFFGSVIGKTFRTAPTLSYPMAKIACAKHFYSPTKAIQELQLPQIPIEVAIGELHSWFKENNYL